MLKSFMTYYNQAMKAVEAGDTTWAKVREATNDEYFQLSQVRPPPFARRGLTSPRR
jgi:V-type H+-transporting ATPase subunit A